MAKFSQTFLKPGRYCVGKDAAGKKLFRDFSASELAEYTTGTTGMIQAGYKPAVFLEHKQANTAEGAPIQLSAQAEKELQLRNGVGWLDTAKVGDDGAALHTIDIRDEAIAGKIRDGSIKFTSPELREEWTDGSGKTHKKVIAHVALTHKPRAINQGEIQPAMQFSLADLHVSKTKAVQLGEPPDFKEEKTEKKPDTTDENPEAKPETKPQNPDLPAEDTPNADAQQFEALRVLAKEQLGLDFPADSDPTTIVRDLVLALKTMKAIKEKDAAEEAEDNAKEDETTGAYEDSGVPMQFSLDESSKPKFHNKLLARLIKTEHAAISGRINKLVVNDQITPKLRDELIGNGGTLQFSTEGDVVTKFTLPQVLDLLERCTVEGQALDVSQLSAADEEAHPKGDDYFKPEGEAMTVADAEKLAADQAARHPGLFKKAS